MKKLLSACLLLVSSSAFAQLQVEADSQYDRTSGCADDDADTACFTVGLELAEADAAYVADQAAQAALTAANTDVTTATAALATANAALAALDAEATEAEVAAATALVTTATANLATATAAQTAAAASATSAAAALAAIQGPQAQARLAQNAAYDASNDAVDAYDAAVVANAAAAADAAAADLRHALRLARGVEPGHGDCVRDGGADVRWHRQGPDQAGRQDRHQARPPRLDGGRRDRDVSDVHLHAWPQA